MLETNYVSTQTKTHWLTVYDILQSIDSNLMESYSLSQYNRTKRIRMSSRALGSRTNDGTIADIHMPYSCTKIGKLHKMHKRYRTAVVHTTVRTFAMCIWLCSIRSAYITCRFFTLCLQSGKTLFLCYTLNRERKKYDSNNNNGTLLALLWAVTAKKKTDENDFWTCQIDNVEKFTTFRNKIYTKFICKFSNLHAHFYWILYGTVSLSTPTTIPTNANDLRVIF